MITRVDGAERSRWDELCSITKIELEIGTMFDSNGVEIFFVNRRAFLNTTDLRDVDWSFAARPSGFTPLVPALKYIFQLPAACRGNDKKLFVFVATDGAPTDERGTPDVPEIECVMRDEHQLDTTFVMFLLCTDDFRMKRETIRHYRGPNYPFPFCDYIIKALVGAVDEEIDALNDPDEPNTSGGH